MNYLITQYKESLQENDLSPQTIQGYLNDLNKFIKWYQETGGGAPRYKNVGPLDLAEFKRHVLNKNQKPATINRAIIALSSFFTWAIFKSYVNSNPASNIKLLPETQATPKSLNRKEQLALMRAVQGKGKVRDIAIITLLLHTGLRVSELCSLTVNDIVLKERTGHLVVRSGKGDKRREVPLNATARSALKEWMDTR
jgi:integrase/recombinase XerC